MMKEILIIEDDPEIIKLLEIHLTDLIYKTDKAVDGSPVPELVGCDVLAPFKMRHDD